MPSKGITFHVQGECQIRGCPGGKHAVSRGSVTVYRICPGEIKLFTVMSGDKLGDICDVLGGGLQYYNIGPILPKNTVLEDQHFTVLGPFFH